MAHPLLINLHDIIIAGGMCAFLCVCHYLSPEVKRLKRIDPAQVISFSGGVAVGYVFLHMLPELVESRDKIHELLQHYTTMTPLKDLIVFFIALLSFELYYLMEYICHKSDLSNISINRRTFRFTLGFYFVYNFLLTYTLILRVATGIFYAFLFTLAMGLHFVLTDRHIKRYFPHLFDFKSRLILLFALIAGFVFSTIIQVNVYIASLLTAFLSGAILYNAFSEEITLTKQTRIAFFFFGTIIMASILALALVYRAQLG